MQAQYRPQPYARLNAFHGPKQQLLGNHAGRAPPAWRMGPSTGQFAANGPARGRQVSMLDGGSKVLLSRLPMDVGETEVEELFKKTVGPLRESFLIYNSQGKSKGMAVVAFQRPGDAVIAKSKFDGAIVDGRRPIKIEVIVESGAAIPSTIPVAPPAPPTLFDRLQNSKAPVPGPSKVVPNVPVGGPAPMSLRFATTANPRRQPNQHTQPPRPATPHNSNFPAPIPPRRYRTKKGPKRLKKQLGSRSKEQLDREMEDYRAAAQDAQV